MLVIKVSLITLFALLRIPTLVTSQPLSNSASRYDIIERRTPGSSGTQTPTTENRDQNLPDCDPLKEGGKIYATLEGMEESTCANILKKSREWAVTTAFICARIKHTSLPEDTKRHTCAAIKQAINWSEVDHVVRMLPKREVLPKVARACERVKKRDLKAVPTGYKVPDASCKMPQTGASPSQPPGSCFITFPDVDVKDALHDQGTQAEIWLRIKALQSELKFPKYDSPYLWFGVDSTGNRVAYTLKQTLLGS